MLFDSKVPFEIIKTKIEAKKQEEKDRKARAGVRMAIYLDRWKEILDDLIKAQFHERNWARLRLHLNISKNVLKQAIDTISNCYNKTVTRSIVGPDGKPLDDKFEPIRHINLDFLMKKVNRYTNLHNNMIVHPYWCYDRDRIEIKLLTPAVTSVIQDDMHPEDFNAIYYDVDYNDSEYKALEDPFIFWSASHHFIADRKDGIPKSPDPEHNADMLNIYDPVIPFVVIHRDQVPGEFWNSYGGEDLVNGTLDIGIQKTNKSRLAKAACYKQAWLRSEADIEGLVFDMLEVWQLRGKDAEAGLLDFAADFKGINDNIKEDINAMLSTYGISLAHFESSQSGKALEIKNRALKEIRHDQIETYRKAEMEIFEMIKIIYNHHKGSNFFPEDCKLKLDYPEMSIYATPQEEMKVDYEAVKLGMLNVYDMYMKYNPDVKDEDEAKERMLKNSTDWKDVKDSGVSVEDILNSEDLKE